MLYQIATGYEGVRQFPQEEIIYLIASLDKIKSHHLSYFFTDGHARSLTSAKYTNDNDFELLDWDTIYTTNWKSDDSDLRRKEKKQAEFMVKHSVPLSCIEYIAVFNNQAIQKVIDLLNIANKSIQVRVSSQKLYYDHI
jgi:ssDNA thymidine ADP-ribosyltransferase, DarT